ncbi:plasmid pRiA4b ORF-3 family protein [Lignipirellula cremea]|uniref:Plasmid pRiA4b ORF-3-like protein n=1 Tax=Lignipirellula cremea TaxID=2528010 RepID=A0A518DPG0_9BACT|nr:plasmid pRiA4b ORF-3 family protein [Lignipirellula cremea]QDU93716.1 Plasmid pRiA4b ORF-3-like protein [Lignipirellula cremea]
MPTKKQIKPGEKVPLKLTLAERKMVLEDLMCLDQDFEQIIRDTPSGEPVMMTLDDLDDFGGYIAAEANHCEDNKKQKKLDAVFEKIQRLLDTYTDEASPQTLKIEDARQKKAISDQAVQIAEFAAKALVAAEQLRIKTKPLDHFWLAPAQRDVLLSVPTLSKAIKNKLAKEKPLTVVEVASMTMALAEDLQDGDARKPLAVLMATRYLVVAKHLMDRLQDGIMAKNAPPARKKSQRKPKAKPDVLYQFKITLLGAKPPIWRRIQVQDCTFDKLHEYIQTAMGWTNSHLHQFEIKGERYGDPELLDDDFDHFDGIDSTTTMLSRILPETGQRFAFKYKYDFGDGWEHEVLYEGCPPLEKDKKYPLCLEGERSCPPEDVGGMGGYYEFLAVIADPEHEDHERLLRWAGTFDPDAFDPKQATKEMKKGLPDWRKM